MIKHSDVPDLMPGELLEMDILGHLAVYIKQHGTRCDLIWVYCADRGEMVITDSNYYKRVEKKIGL